MNNEPNTRQAQPAPATPRSRRGFWLAGGVAAVIGISALGACSHHRGGGWQSDGDPSSRIESMVDRVFSHVDATAEQKTKITGIATKAFQDLSPVRAELRDARGKALDLLTANTVDRAAMEALRSEQISRLDKASARASTAMADIAEVLTPEQRIQVREKIASRMHKRQRWGHWRHGS